MASDGVGGRIFVAISKNGGGAIWVPSEEEKRKGKKVVLLENVVPAKGTNPRIALERY